MTQDDQYLRLLSIFHYVVAGIAALFSLVPTIHIAVGIGLVSGAFTDPREPFPFALVGWFLIAFGSIFIMCGFTFAVCLFLAGRFLNQRRRYLFCLVMAGVACMFMPFGTVLGIFTIVMLLKENVKGQFEPANGRATSPSPPTA
ncbi:MAG: hypothetical protein WBS54_07295 [Acidobacteriota bacterium]